MTLVNRIFGCFLFAKFFLYLCPDEKYKPFLSLLLEWSLMFLIVTSILGMNMQKWQDYGVNLWGAMQQVGNDTKGPFEEKDVYDMAKDLIEQTVRDEQQVDQEDWDGDKRND